MDAFIQFLIDWGYLGMFLSAFLAGSIVPFSSEAVLAALVIPSTGLNPWLCLIAATVGNTLGSLTCYAIGRMGKIDWLTKYFRMDPKKIRSMRIYLYNRSAYMAFFAFVPVVGSLIIVALGFLRSNIWSVTISMILGKILRYVVVILIALGLFNYF